MNVSAAVICFLVLALDVARSGTFSSNVTFTDYTPLSSNVTLAQRMLSPLTAAKLPQLLAQGHQGLTAQPVDLVNERFVLYVPSTPPPAGFGLLVFVPPWDAAKMPDEWAQVFDQYAMIYVSAVRSGNDASVLGRREPLALLAEQNVVKRYPVDPSRIYISGFSGGSRVAMRLALAYPDVFRGAILNAGSDPVGNQTIPLPARDLFSRFQESSTLVYVTGANDVFVQNADRRSMQSMRHWCVFNIVNQSSPFAFHEAIGSVALAKALDVLSPPGAPDRSALGICRSTIDAEMRRKLDVVRALMSAGQPRAARDMLTSIDQQYGGLAAPESVDLDKQLTSN
ncbi:MAG: PHB depolymerase family esterase [Rhizomicrobium sp.]